MSSFGDLLAGSSHERMSRDCTALTRISGVVSGLLTQVQAMAAGMLTRARKAIRAAANHLKWQRHHRKKDADGTPKSKAPRSGCHISRAKSRSPSLRCSHVPRICLIRGKCRK